MRCSSIGWCRARSAAVGGRDQVDRAAHEPGAHHAAVLQEPDELGGPEAVQPRPQAGVGLERLLRLQPDQVLDGREDRHPGPLQQQLAGQGGPVERPGVERRHGRTVAAGTDSATATGLPTAPPGATWKGAEPLSRTSSSGGAARRRVGVGQLPAADRQPGW
jgi:hypothetical protein